MYMNIINSRQIKVCVCGGGGMCVCICGENALTNQIFKR